MFKQITFLVAAALALFTTAMANPFCNKNAWVAFNTARNGMQKACGRMSITSGKSAYDLPTATAMDALNACAYSSTGCSGSWVDNNHWEFCCGDDPNWKPNYSGTMNIEFNCHGNDRSYSCYDVHWN